MLAIGANVYGARGRRHYKMRKELRLIKRAVALFLMLLLSIESFGAVVSDNDGSAFITKAEFDSLKNDFQSQIDQYNTSIDAKIDGAIAAYLAGVIVNKKIRKTPISDWSEWKFIAYPTSVRATDGMWDAKNTWKKDGAFNPIPSGWRYLSVGPNWGSLGASNGGTSQSLVHYAENRWSSSDSTVMEANYELDKFKLLHQDAYFFLVEDRTDGEKKKRVKGIYFGYNNLEYVQWKSGNWFWVDKSARSGPDLYPTYAHQANCGFPTAYDLTVYPPSNLIIDPYWVYLKQTRDTTHGGSGQSCYAYEKYDVGYYANYVLDYDFNKKTIGFCSSAPTNFDLCIYDDSNGILMNSADVDIVYTYLREEGPSLSQIGYTEAQAPKTGDAVPVSYTYRYFNQDADSILLFNKAYNQYIYEITKIDVPFYGGMPILETDGNGTVTLEIEGTSDNQVDFLIKKGPFTGWRKIDDEGNCVDVINVVNGTKVTTTPANGSKITIRFDIENNATYYFKCGIGGGIKITSDIEEVIE